MKAIANWRLAIGHWFLIGNWQVAIGNKNHGNSIRDIRGRCPKSNEATRLHADRCDRALLASAPSPLFSLVNAVLLQPLPFAEPDRLVWVWGNIRNGGSRASVSLPDYLDYRQQNSTFEEFAAAIGGSMPLNLTGSGEPEPLSGAAVTGNYFKALGTPPALGRTFLLENESRGTIRWPS